MKSHSYIPTTHPKYLARKINRAGPEHLLDEEKEFVRQETEKVAELCTEERAKELFEFVGKEFPHGFFCRPVAGEKDAYIARLKTESDALFGESDGD